jgi:hypothetical protein
MRQQAEPLEYADTASAGKKVEWGSWGLMDPPELKLRLEGLPPPPGRDLESARRWEEGRQRSSKMPLGNSAILSSFITSRQFLGKQSPIIDHPQNFKS